MYIQKEQNRDAVIAEIAIHLGDEWSYRPSNGYHRFGSCRFDDKTITVSDRILESNPIHVVIDIVRHEIAHALAGHKAGHGREWKKKCLELECRTDRTCTHPDLVHPIMIPKWIGTCPSCGRQVERQRRMKHACGSCCKKYNGGRFSKKYLFKYEKYSDSNYGGLRGTYA